MTTQDPGSDVQGCGPPSLEHLTGDKAYMHDALVHPLENYSAKSVYGSAFCKRPICVQLLVQDDVITDMGGEVEGCSYSRHCLGTLINMVKGMDVNTAWGITGDELRQNMDKPDPRLDCETYVVAALKLALRNWEKRV